MYGTLNKHSLFLNKLPFPWRRGQKKKKRFKTVLQIQSECLCTLPVLHFYSDAARFPFFHFTQSFLEVSSDFWCSYMAACVDMRAWFCLVRVCALFGTCGARHFISCQDGGRYTNRNETRGRIQQRSASMARRNGNRKKTTCLRSHCASNVITGGDSTMWHAALPICQSEIGRVTNGYHCYFPQPPPPPPPPVLMFASCSEEEGWPKPGW